LLLCVLGACSGPEGLWRDQYVFVGDDGMVMPMGVLRWSEGHAEVKAWVGEEGRWQTSLHRRFAIAGRDASSLERTLQVFSAQSGPSARIGVQAQGDALNLDLRTPSRASTLTVEHLRALGRDDDPEGSSTYAFGRAVLRSGTTRRQGWVVSESTPPDHPKRAYVDYGDFALVFAASQTGGALVLKRSLTRSGFDHGFVALGSDVRETQRVSCELSAEEVHLRLPELAVDHRLDVSARSISRGVAPGGGAVRYETLLLRGEFSGVAFLIHPDSGGTS